MHASCGHGVPHPSTLGSSSPLREDLSDVEWTFPVVDTYDDTYVDTWYNDTYVDTQIIF